MPHRDGNTYKVPRKKHRGHRMHKLTRALRAENRKRKSDATS